MHCCRYIYIFNVVILLLKKLPTAPMILKVDMAIRVTVFRIQGSSCIHLNTVTLGSLQVLIVVSRMYKANLEIKRVQYSH